MIQCGRESGKYAQKKIFITSRVQWEDDADWSQSKLNKFKIAHKKPWKLPAEIRSDQGCKGR